MDGFSPAPPSKRLIISRFSGAAGFASRLYKRLSLREKRSHRTLHLLIGAISMAIREAWADPAAADALCRQARAKGKRRELRVTRLVLGGGGRCQETPDRVNRFAGCAAYAAAPLNGDPAPGNWKDAARYIGRRGGYQRLAKLYAKRCTDNGDWAAYVARQADAIDDWWTPSRIFILLGCEFDLDPCSPGRHKTPWIPCNQFFTEHGLEREWFGFVWCNPPFGRGVIQKWVRKFIEHGNGIIVVPDRTRSPWWQELCAASDLMLFINRPISFLNYRGETVGQHPVGTHLVAIGHRGVEALKNASRGGLGYLAQHVKID